MKKILLIVFSIFFIFFYSINTYADVECAVTMEDGASIRTTGNQGLRFTAEVNEFPASSSHGFFLVLGEVEKDTFVSAIESHQEKIDNKKIVDKPITGSDTTFSVVIYNIDNAHYEQKITALAYVKLSSGTYVFSDIAVSRDIMQVVKNAYEKGNNAQFIKDIFHTKYDYTKYNLGYGFSSIDELRDAILADFNTYASKSYTLETLKDNAHTSGTYTAFSEFIGNSEYSKKWYWFFDYIADLRFERKEDIEEFATSNYPSYFPNHNIINYTPCMKAIVEDYSYASGLGPFDTSERLWILEFSAFFGRDGFSYYNAFTFDWSEEKYDYIYDSIILESNNAYKESSSKNSTITYEPIRNGYNFVGWYTVNENSFIEQKTTTNENVEDLYAGWEKADTYYVDSSLDGSITNLRYNNLKFEYGVTAFNNINAALSLCTSGGTIYVGSGTYSENITISHNDITLIGNNGGISGNATRMAESNFTGTITINSGISNLIIDGFKFSGNSKIVNKKGSEGTAQNPKTNLNGFKFINNYAYTNIASGSKVDEIETLNGFICFKEAANSYSHDLVFDNNHFEASNNSATYNAIVLLDNFYNLTFTNNKLLNAPVTALRVDDTTKGASGKYVIIKNNEIINAKHNAIDIDWVSPLESHAYIDISNNTLINTGNLGIYLGKFNNTDSYDYIKIDRNILHGFTNGVLVVRSTENAQVSVSFNEFYGNPSTYFIKLNNSDATNPREVKALSNLYYDIDGNELSSYPLVGNIEDVILFYISQTGNGTIKVGDTYNLSTNLHSNISWTSSAPLVASVENGVVTANGIGNAIITATTSSGAEATIGLTVYNPNTASDLVKLLIENNNSLIWNENITYIGYQGNAVNNVNGSANNYYPGSLPSITEKPLSNKAKNYSGITITDLTYITIHDTGSSSQNSNAFANAAWCTNSANTKSSWHYTVGNDGIYHQVPDNIVAWHAGDGERTATLDDTKIPVTKSLRYRPTITMGNDGYFYLDGVRTNVKYPAGGLSEGMNILGVGVVIKDGYYYIPSTRITSDYGSVVTIKGGNMQSIGIETAVNDGSDVYLTWQYTAKLVANLLVNNNLGPDRVMFHNNFSNKPCPNTMINAHKTDTFLDMCYVEYMVKKYYSDYDISFTSLNPTYLDNYGRVVKNPNLPLSVGYTITIKQNGDTVDAVTLYSTIMPKSED